MTRRRVKNLWPCFGGMQLRLRQAPAVNRGAVSREATRSAKQSITTRLAVALPWAAAVLVMSLAVVMVIWWPRAMGAFPVERVSVAGVSVPQRQQQLQAVLYPLVVNRGYFSLSLSDLHKQAMTLPWVESAEIRRHWPDQLHVVVQERVPVAKWNDDRLVSIDGKAYASDPRSQAHDLPSLSGPDGHLDEVMNYYLSMGRILDFDATQILSLEVDASMTATVLLSDGVTLIVDRANYAEKLRRYVRLRSWLQAAGKQPQRVDLRYEDGMAVTWQQQGNTNSGGRDT